MKQGRYCALALGCALLLTGCESWRRLPSPDAPKEVTAASIWQLEEEQPAGAGYGRTCSGAEHGD